MLIVQLFLFFIRKIWMKRKSERGSLRITWRVVLKGISSRSHNSLTDRRSPNDPLTDNEKFERKHAEDSFSLSLSFFRGCSLVSKMSRRRVEHFKKRCLKITSDASSAFMDHDRPTDHPRDPWTVIEKPRFASSAYTSHRLCLLRFHTCS